MLRFGNREAAALCCSDGSPRDIGAAEFRPMPLQFPQRFSVGNPAALLRREPPARVFHRQGTAVVPSERAALQAAVSPKYLEDRGLEEGSHGEIVTERGARPPLTWDLRVQSGSGW
jgi:hypothetical protein